MSSAILRAAGHVVGDRERGGAEALDAVDDQIVDDVGHDRVEAGGRLVEEDDLGIGGDGAGEAHPLLHAARQLGRIELADLGAEPDLAELGDGDLPGLARGACFLPWMSPKATFCQTGRRRTARRPGTACRSLRRTLSRCEPDRPTTSSPSMRIEPESGWMRPRMHLSITDLPVPEPPITTSDSPR